MPEPISDRSNNDQRVKQTEEAHDSGNLVDPERSRYLDRDPRTGVGPEHGSLNRNLLEGAGILGQSRYLNPDATAGVGPEHAERNREALSSLGTGQSDTDSEDPVRKE